MKLEVTVSEIEDILKKIQKKPGQLFEMIRLDIRESISKYVTAVITKELLHHIFRNMNHCSDSCYCGFDNKDVGEVPDGVSKNPNRKFHPFIISRNRQHAGAVTKDFSFLFLGGVSSRTLSAISEKLIGRKISSVEIGYVINDLNAAIEAWRRRDLSQKPIRYLFADRVFFQIRVGKSTEVVTILVAIGVMESGQKLVLGFKAGDKASSTSWRDFFKDLKSRGLDSEKVVLGLMDVVAGLERVFTEEFPKAKIQYCQGRVARNVLDKVPEDFKEDMASEIRSIFYAASHEKAWERYGSFRQRWQKTVPFAAEYLERSIDNCLTFFNFPSEEWISLRSINIIERLNREFRRQSKSMKIEGEDASFYRLLAYMSLKMELNWRSTPVGKVPKNLPFFKELAYEHAAQGN